MHHVILTGFSGTGKSRVGREVARLLGRPFVDTDEEIERRAGRPVHAIFETEGEPAFRALERQVLQEALAGPPAVVATGGGAFVDAENRALMLRSGVVVCLEARPETLLRRLGSGRGAVRPLLRGGDPLERIVALKGARQTAYAQAHWTLHTDHLTAAEAAREVVWAVERLRGRLFPTPQSPSLAATVEHSGGSYPILVGWGLVDAIGEELARVGVQGPCYIVSDDRVFAYHGRQLQRALQRAQVEAHAFIVPAGERSKSLTLAQAIYGWLAERRAERGHAVIAYGGGAVGDLAGFVAATYLRGMPFVQVPTSLAAMNDAAIGGKVAVNLPQGKNLVGAFHQPRLVLADPALLRTLPRREQAEGWAEAIKHGLILDADLFDTFARRSREILALQPEVVTEAIKARVVSEDERETMGRRILLNYGHTIGHALEAATAYGTYLHGEAVAVGMMGAALLGQRLGLIGPQVVARQQQVLEAYGLPVRAPGVEPEALLRAMEVDKKTAGRSLRWVLLERVGRAVVRGDVPRVLVLEVLDELTRP